MFGEEVAGAAFVRRVAEGVEEADGDALDALAPEDGDQVEDGVFVEREEDRPLVVEALGDGQAEVTRDEGLGEGDVEVVLVVAALIAHREDVAETLGRDECGYRAFPLNDRVCGERGAVNEDLDIGRGEAGLGEDGGDAVEDALLGMGRGGEDLGGDAAGAGLEREVGEGSADIDREAGGGPGLLHMRERAGPFRAGQARPVFAGSREERER